MQVHHEECKSKCKKEDYCNLTTWKGVRYVHFFKNCVHKVHVYFYSIEYTNGGKELVMKGCCRGPNENYLILYMSGIEVIIVYVYKGENWKILPLIKVLNEYLVGIWQRKGEILVVICSRGFVYVKLDKVGIISNLILCSLGISVVESIEVFPKSCERKRFIKLFFICDRMRRN